MTEQAAVSTGVDALRMAGGLLQLVRALEQQMRTASGENALTLSELGVLTQVRRGVDAPTQIARALRLDPARITHLTDKLVTRGYLERAVDPEDRRRWRLTLTELGTTRTQSGVGEAQAAMERLLADLTPEEVAGLNLGLDGVRRILAALPSTS